MYQRITSTRLIALIQTKDNAAVGHIPTVYTHEEEDHDTLQPSPGRTRYLHRWGGEQTKHCPSQRTKSVHSINKQFINIINRKGINMKVCPHRTLIGTYYTDAWEKDGGGEETKLERWKGSEVCLHPGERYHPELGVVFASLCQSEITVTSSLRSTSWLASHELHHGRRAPPSAPGGS